MAENFMRSAIALILGAIAERMKFSAVLAFVTLWMLVVYFPLAHMVWGINGMMNGVWNKDATIKAIDFAGGTVVHMSSGWSALILCLILGKRMGVGKENMSPHSMVLCSIGTGMLWVGWYGFNAGSAVAADGVAANAFMTTTIATAVACFVWPLMEWITRGKPSVLGACSGAVAGLVCITPASGYVQPMPAILIGLAAGIVPWFFCYKVKGWFGYDDALDTFGVHAVGGTLGAILTGVFATKHVCDPVLVSANGHNVGLIDGEVRVFIGQLVAVVVTWVFAGVVTYVLLKILDATMGLRVKKDEELQGLDLSQHGEEGYIFL